MKISCVRCGRKIAIAKEMLGSTGKCPHCQSAIVLPRASDQVEDENAQERSTARQWIDGTVSGLTSMVLHMTVLILFALLQGDAPPGPDHGEVVSIGTLATEDLVSSPTEELGSESPAESPSASALDASLEVEPSPTQSSDASDTMIEVALAAPAAGGGDPNGFDLGAGATSASGGGGGGSWDGMIQNLRRNGLDIVIVFDSTGSMSGEIDTVKRNIERIGGALFKLVPKTRIGMVTYRDQGDDFVAKGIPLTTSLSEVQKFLYEIDADGGGDTPEAVDAGLSWAIEKNQFRGQARKVILVFGDAPPHAANQKRCESLAQMFRKSNYGVVSTVTCRGFGGEPMPELKLIAEAGGGEAFLNNDTKQIMTQLMVLVFGSRHREKVVEALKLTE